MMFANEKLAQLRIERQLSRSDLHRQLILSGSSCCRAMVDRWETGKSEPSASDAWLLAKVLHVPVAELFIDTEQR